MCWCVRKSVAGESFAYGALGVTGGRAAPPYPPCAGGRAAPPHVTGYMPGTMQITDLHLEVTYTCMYMHSRKQGCQDNIVTKFASFLALLTGGVQGKGRQPLSPNRVSKETKKHILYMSYYAFLCVCFRLRVCRGGRQPAWRPPGMPPCHHTGMGAYRHTGLGACHHATIQAYRHGGMKA